mgnify:CR=1 FL=1
MRYIFLIIIFLFMNFNLLSNNEIDWVKNIRKDLIKIKETYTAIISKEGIDIIKLKEFTNSNNCIIKEIGINSFNIDKSLKNEEEKKLFLELIDDCCKNVSIAAIDKLRKCEDDNEVLSKIFAKSKDDDKNLRYFSILYLTDKVNRVPFDSIKDFLEDNYWRIRERMIYYISKYEGKLYEDYILKALEDESENVKIAAITYFFKEKNKNAIEPLKELLSSKNKEIIKYSIRALGNQDDIDIFNHIKEFAYKNDLEIKRETIIAIGKSNNKEAKIFLEELCKKEKGDMENECIWALDNLKKINY